MANYRLTESLLVFPDVQEVVPTPNTDNEAWKNLIADVSPQTQEEKLRLAEGASYMVFLKYQPKKEFSHVPNNQ